jgi:hypothetical protein
MLAELVIDGIDKAWYETPRPSFYFWDSRRFSRAFTARDRTVSGK